MCLCNSKNTRYTNIKDSVLFKLGRKFKVEKMIYHDVNNLLINK